MDFNEKSGSVSNGVVLVHRRHKYVQKSLAVLIYEVMLTISFII